MLVGQWRRGHTLAPNRFVHAFGLVYLVVLAALWASALPGYFGAVHGVTADGTPTGNLAYASLCFAVAALAVIGVSGTRARAPLGSAHTTG